MEIQNNSGWSSVYRIENCRGMLQMLEESSLRRNGIQTGRASSMPERISRSGRFLASWNVFPGWNVERIFPPSKIVYTTSEKPPRCEIRCIKTGVHGSVQYNSGKWHALLGRVYTGSDILSRDALEIEAPRAHNPRLWTSTCFEAYLVNR